MAGSRDPSNQVFGNRSHAFLFNRLLRRTERHNLYNTIMKKLFIGLLFGVSISQISMAQTYTVRVYDMTPKYATYTTQETPTVKLPESKQTTNTYADYLEEQIRIRRLQAELRELEKQERQRLDPVRENAQTEPNKQTSTNDQSGKHAVYDSSPLYDIPDLQKGKGLRTSKSGYVTIINKHNDNFFFVEMDGVKGYLWKGWLK